MDKKYCFITGANSGIGKSAAIQLARQGFYVLIGSRNMERGLKALSEIKRTSKSDLVELIEIDMSSKKSILDASNRIKDKISMLDVLIHNAADFDISRKQPEKSNDGVETVWATNHIGPVLLTDLLLSLIQQSSQGRIITVASKGLILHPHLTISLDDPEFKSRKYSVAKAYYHSKLAQLMYTYWLADKLKETKITVNCIRVTNVKIDIHRFPKLPDILKFIYRIKSIFSISPDKMAKTYIYLAASEKLKGVTGKYFNEKNMVVKSSKYSKNIVNINAVMNLTMKYIK